jgi:hypothetical protein
MSTSTTTSSSTEGVPENKAGSSTLPVSPLDQTDILAYIHKYSSYDAEKLEDLGTLLQRKYVTLSFRFSQIAEKFLAPKETSQIISCLSYECCISLSFSLSSSWFFILRIQAYLRQYNSIHPCSRIIRNLISITVYQFNGVRYIDSFESNRGIFIIVRVIFIVHGFFYLRFYMDYYRSYSSSKLSDPGNHHET